MEPEDEPLIRIGELSRRLGVSVDRLRAWERRYQLLQPMRTSGGFRLYSRADELRVRAMQDHLAAGLSAAEAARAALAADAAAPANASRRRRAPARDLSEALTEFDAIRAHALIDRLLAELGADAAIRDVILPLLHDLGERWVRAEVDVGQEHFASRLIEARLLALLRGSDRRRRTDRRCWPARRENFTPSASSPSESPCATAAGGSPTSAPTPPSRASAARPARSPRTRRALGRHAHTLRRHRSPAT